MATAQSHTAQRPLSRREFNEQRLDHLRTRIAELEHGDDEAQEHAYQLRIDADELEHYMGLDDMESA